MRLSRLFMSSLHGEGLDRHQCRRRECGPGIDIEDGPKGFGAHSDQERLLESELHRFVRFYWDVVAQVAGS